MKEKPLKLMLAVTKSNWGGAQRYVYDIAHHFHTNPNFEVTVLVGGDGDLVKKLHEASIRVVSLPSLGRDVKIFKDFLSLVTLFKIIVKEKPDILHVNSSKVSLFGTMVGRLCRIPKIVFTAHGWPFNEVRPLYQRLVFRIFGMLTVFFAHKTIAVSRSVMISLRAPSFISKKITVVYTGIEPPHLYKEGAFFETFSTTKKNGVQIVSIGELHMSKGIDRALIALAQCKHLHWTYHIIGDGEKRGYLENLVSQLGLTERVHFYGFVENASLYFNSFDLFLFPSRTEALGYVAIEAIFSKLPIIASNVGGIPEVLFDDPYSKVINCDDEKKFKETLFSFLKKLPVVDETKRPGRMRFLPRFMFTATKKIYLG